MRFVLWIFLLASGFGAFAQDEFPDYRSKKDNFTKMREKDIRNDLSIFTMAGIEESMGKLPLKNIPMTDYGRNFMTYEGDNIKVTIKTGIFNPSKHKLAFFEEKHLSKIDNKPYYGSYDKVPKTTIEAVTVIVNNKDTVSIPASAFNDLYNPSFTYKDESGTERSLNNVFLSPDKHKIYIYMLNREASGTYEVTWVIQDNKYLRRVLDFGLLK